MVHRPAANGDAPEPCYDCECCLAWTTALGLLRRSIEAHAKAELDVTIRGDRLVASCGNPDCLVCVEVGWQSPSAP